MAFKLRSGNTTNFKSMGSSPAKQRLNKGGEGQDQDKIFKNGEHVGDWVNGKKVMHTNKGKDKEFNRMIREHEFDHEKIVRPKEKKVIHRDIDDRELDKVKKKSPNKQKKSLVDPKTGLNQLEKAYTLNPSDETTRMMLAEYYKQSASKKATKKAVKGIKTAASKSKSKSKTTSKAAKALANLTVKGASNKQKK